MPVFGLGWWELADLAYDAIYDSSGDHLREHFRENGDPDRTPTHDEIMEVLAASWAVIGGGGDFRDPIILGWARLAHAVAYEANEEAWRTNQQIEDADA